MPPWGEVAMQLGPTLGGSIGSSPLLGEWAGCIGLFMKCLPNSNQRSHVSGNESILMTSLLCYAAGLAGSRATGAVGIRSSRS